ncbi:2-polyprenylphenol hydroxylase and related flavodoxin oxidoreductase [Thioalkalivibrio nitratireducens DSM 14787]|uniref:2-polyprenylphenol hydroxylase and related flavodoxin oxidoreductase n=1 Tax=Thioalkalivibrio nitratireducens (strain DSM 14787 / UNIQEM 213 / ALEN2) TaxID=1255043 RepID=L0DXT8_THIND|nr:FAD/NAD(P)-binding protein [Thioalkalivibrio nitratireducens]AGA33827.1 2-polyprenylphenol hydroxylase and related flavodoxin oxidoreductase [Thioalkalivibrio nitratireducens DSM 14787]
MHNPDRPFEVEVVERVEETPTIYTLHLRFTDPGIERSYRCQPGQFNMLYLYGVGEIPISIVSDPDSRGPVEHTIRSVGRVTRGMEMLRVGDRIGLRGPYGRGWPLQEAEGRDVVFVTGGLGCAPLVSLIRYVVERRERFGRIVILQGVKHSDDLIWRRQYERWQRLPDVQVLLASDVGGPNWPYSVGRVTVLFSQAAIDPDRSIVMLCGPEVMMKSSIERLLAIGVPPEVIWLSIERNMQCGIGHCGHCQLGPYFVCHDGPVFHYPALRPWLGVTGF